MNMIMEKNSRGILEVSRYALEKMFTNDIELTIGKIVKKIEVEVEIYRNISLYVLVKLTVKNDVFLNAQQENDVIKAIDRLTSQTLNIKAKNIAIAYIR